MRPAPSHPATAVPHFRDPPGMVEKAEQTQGLLLTTFGLADFVCENMQNRKAVKRFGIVERGTVTRLVEGGEKPLSPFCSGGSQIPVAPQQRGEAK